MTADDQVAGARAAILARLWGAFAREPLPGIARRRVDGPDLVVTLVDGRELRGSVEAGQPFARAAAGLAVAFSGAPMHDDPAEHTHNPADRTRNPATHTHTHTHTHNPADHTHNQAGQMHDPADLVSAALGNGDLVVRLADELRNSVANLAMARAAQPPPTGGPATLAGSHSTDLEQSIIDGHPLHPLCRTRMGMSAAEVRAYAPEYRPVVALAVVGVPPERWHTTGTGLPPRLVMHPWQRDHVLDAHPALRPTGELLDARPLMSLRTLAPIGQPRWHLKTAVGAQMTSAVRTVSPAAVHNGPLMSALLAEVCAGTAIGVLAEPAAGAVLVDGAPARGLAIIYRRAPMLAAGEIAMPVAALSAPSPASGRALVTEAIAMRADGDPEAFFAGLVTLALPPLLRLLHRGVALEAHGQNTLVVLRAGHPVRLLYRDMGGVRVSPARLAAAGFDAPPLRGDLATDDADALRAKLAAALLGTVVAELIATVTREYSVPPPALWRTAARVIRHTYSELPVAARADRAAMLGATLPCKAMTAMRLSPTPLEDIWTPIANPMADIG